MDSIIAAAASGMRSRMETLDILANNIANAGTTGYKADEESYSLYFGDRAWEGYNEGRPDTAEMPVLQQSWTNWSQGTLLPTGNSDDLALSSPGFFVVTGSNGDALYTRDGHFKVSKTGILQTQDGYSVQSAAGKEIKLDVNSGFEVTPAGDVQQNGGTVARIAVVNPSDLKTASRAGAGYFKFSTGTKFAPAADPGLQQGKIETSNVAPASSAVKLVTVMRSFEMLQKAVMMAYEENRKVVEEVAKVGS